MRSAIARIMAAAFLTGGFTGSMMALRIHAAHGESAATIRNTASVIDDLDRLDRLKASFRRPATVPFPVDNPLSEKKRALGEALFHDTRLSIDNSRSCASCHDRAKGFADGKAQGQGVPGRLLKRHTPTLWNLAWAAPVFWDPASSPSCGRRGPPTSSCLGRKRSTWWIATTAGVPGGPSPKNGTT